MIARWLTSMVALLGWRPAAAAARADAGWQGSASPAASARAEGAGSADKAAAATPAPDFKLAARLRSTAVLNPPSSRARGVTARAPRHLPVRAKDEVKRARKETRHVWLRTRHHAAAAPATPLVVVEMSDSRRHEGAAPGSLPARRAA